MLSFVLLAMLSFEVFRAANAMEPGVRAVYSNHPISHEHFREAFVRDCIRLPCLRDSGSEVLSNGPRRFEIRWNSQVQMSHGTFYPESSAYRLSLDHIEGTVNGSWELRDDSAQDYGVYQFELHGGVLNLTLAKDVPPDENLMKCSGSLKRTSFNMRSYRNWFHGREYEMLKEHLKKHLYRVACRGQKRLFLAKIMPDVLRSSRTTYSYDSIFYFMNGDLILNYSLVGQPHRDHHYFKVDTVGYFHWRNEPQKRYPGHFAALPEFVAPDETSLPNEPGPTSLFFVSRYLIQTWFYTLIEKNRLNQFVQENRLQNGAVHASLLFNELCSHGSLCMKYYLPTDKYSQLDRAGNTTSYMLNCSEVPQVELKQNHINLQGKVEVIVFASSYEEKEYLIRASCDYTFAAKLKAKQGKLTGTVAEPSAATVEWIQRADGSVIELDPDKLDFCMDIARYYMTYRLREIMNIGLPMPVLEQSEWTESQVFIQNNVLAIVARRRDISN